MQIIKNNKKSTSQSYYDSFFCTTNLDWKRIYLLSRKTIINTNLRAFQFKISNNVLYLSKTLFRFKKVKSPLCFFCKSAEETAVHLFNSFSLSQSIWSQTQVLFSNYFTIPIISPESAILGFLQEIQDQHNIIINHILLIYKHYVYLSRNSESLNFIIGLKNCILETKILEEKKISTF